MIEAVARQFENANPASTLAELEDYLRSKAKEWSDLRARIERLDEADLDLADLKASAIDALDQGDYTEADEALQKAEETQLNGSALREVGKLVELRVTRGDVKLTAGDPTTALSHYFSAAEMLRPLSEARAADLLNEIAHALYESGRRSLRSHFEVAAKLLEKCLTFESIQGNKHQSSKTSYQISLIFRNEASLRSKGDRDRILYNEKAIQYAREAVTAFSSIEADSEEELFDLISAEIALGNSLFDKARFHRDAKTFEETVQMFRATVSRLSKLDGMYELKAHAANSLGSALMTSLEARKDTATSAALTEVIQSYKQAIAAAEQCSNTEVWGVAHGNMGGALILLAASTTDTEDAHFLRVRGISALQTAIETYPTVLFPMPHAQMHLRLGEALVQHGLKCSAELMELYLVRALGSYHLAANILDEERHPSDWAFIQAELSRIFFAHSHVAEAKIAKFDLDQSANHMKNAVRVHESMNSKKEAAACRKALKKIEEAQESEGRNPS